MPTYTIQNLQPSGDTFALMYDDHNRIIQTCGPLHWTDVALILDNEDFAALDWTTEDAAWANAQTWGYPQERQP